MKHALLFLLAFWTFALLPAPTVRAQAEDHAANSTSAQSSCEEFEVITNAAPLSFKPLRGKLQGIEQWKGHQALPGTSNCIVFGRGDYASYICSTATVRGEDRVQALFDTFKSQVEQCLGDDWAAMDYTTRRGDPRISYWNDHASYDVCVAIESFRGREDDEVRLIVSRR